MRSDIRILDALVANQIAAGEVVERPASVVKELLENALDAGATNIAVSIVEGGLKEIDVTDDGAGIAPEQVELAFVRHATSKLRTMADLRRLANLGFRGEALPSIASVGRVSMRTRVAGQDAGVEVELEGGELRDRRPVGCPLGTRVRVRDLFFNTPARLKFVRSLQTETSHVLDVVGRAAAARPDAAISVTVDGRRQFATPGDGELVSVFREVYSHGVSERAMALLFDAPEYSGRGLLGAPADSRTSRTGFWFSINGRAVRSLALGQAVLEGCHTLIPRGRYPIVMLNLAMDPELVDVNVHPAKWEVRFSEERDVRELVRRATLAGIEAGAGIPDMRLGGGPRTAQGAPAHTESPDGPTDGPQQPRPFVQGDGSRGGNGSAYGGVHGGPAAPGGRKPAQQQSVQAALQLQEPLTAYGGGPAAQELASASAPAEAAALAERIGPADADVAPVGLGVPGAVAVGGTGADVSAAGVQRLHGVLRPVAQVLNMYIVAEDGDAVYLIDQHAAHERVLFEKFRAAFAAGQVRPVELLVPLTVDVRPQDVATLAALAGQAAVVGLQYELFGERSFLIRTIPHIWEGLNLDRLVGDTFAELVEQGEAPSHLWLEDRIVLRSCKAAVKANHRLSVMEMEALLQSLVPLENPFTCPHGRPTALRITRSRLEREFGRSQ